MGKSKKVDYLAQAVGSAEAAGILGIHWTQPARMVEKGQLTSHLVTGSLYSDDPSRTYAIYDGAECEANYQDYDERFRAAGGKTERRPRSWLHTRPDALRHLKAVKAPIVFADAIGMAEAAKILCVHQTLIPRLIASGKVVGRKPWNPRGKTGSKVFIISRRSCQENVKEMRALEAAGKKPGRPRKKVS
jgi:hypothetical protein